MKLVIIIPAYNEEKTINSVVKGIPSNVPGISDIKIIVVDDGSADSTSDLAKSAGALVISHDKNKGLGIAFQTGVKAALKLRADIMVSIDADSQFNALDIPRLIQPILENKADFVSGSRFMAGASTPNIPKTRLIGNKIINRFISLAANRKFTDVSCGFRAYSKETLLWLNLFGKFTYTQEVILNLNFKNLRMAEVPITAQYFKERKSHISGSLFKYCLRASKIILRTIIDYKPLKFFGGSGALLFVLGLVFDIIMFSIFLKTGQFTPYKFVGIAGVIFNVFGLFLFIIGVVGELLNRLRQNQERIVYYLKKKYYE